MPICEAIYNCCKINNFRSLEFILNIVLLILDSVNYDTSLYPPHKMWGGGLYWIRFVASVGPSVRRSVRLQFLSAL